MEKLFYKKWTSVMIVASVILILLLLCMLLTFLAQQASFEQQTALLNSLIEQAEYDAETQKKIIEYKQTDQYVIEWALDQGLINKDHYLLIPIE